MEIQSQIFSASSSPALKSRRPFKVFALPAGWSGCAFWRFRLPLNKLKQIGTHLDISIADNPNKTVRLDEIQANVGNSDLIALQAPGHRDSYTLMKLYKNEGKKVVIDYDDYSFDLSPGNPRYAELGTKECELMGPDGTPVYRWRDGENGFDLQSNIAKFNAFKACVELADMVTTTTEYLADKFRKHNNNVVVCPNSIDFDLWRPLPRPDSLKDQVRLGWFGGDSHYVDLKPFKDLLPKLCKKYPHLKIVIQAPIVPEWKEFFSGIPQDQLEWYNWADLRYYTLFLASRHFDIGLCPLDLNDFNFCKSSIKAFEFQALGAAVVAQNCPPYSVTIRDGDNGILASTDGEWFNKISRLIEDVQYRNKIAMQGYLDVKDKWDLEKNARIWESHYTNLLEGNINVDHARDVRLGLRG